jgi:hypothetical protein
VKEPSQQPVPKIYLSAHPANHDVYNM